MRYNTRSCVLQARKCVRTRNAMRPLFFFVFLSWCKIAKRTSLEEIGSGKNSSRITSHRYPKELFEFAYFFWVKKNFMLIFFFPVCNNFVEKWYNRFFVFFSFFVKCVLRYRIISIRITIQRNEASGLLLGFFWLYKTLNTWKGYGKTELEPRTKKVMKRTIAQREKKKTNSRTTWTCKSVQGAFVLPFSTSRQIQKRWKVP